MAAGSRKCSLRVGKLEYVRRTKPVAAAAVAASSAAAA